MADSLETLNGRLEDLGCVVSARAAERRVVPGRVRAHLGPCIVALSARAAPFLSPPAPPYHTHPSAG